MIAGKEMFVHASPSKKRIEIPMQLRKKGIEAHVMQQLFDAVFLLSLCNSPLKSPNTTEYMYYVNICICTDFYQHSVVTRFPQWCNAAFMGTLEEESWYHRKKVMKSKL